MIDLKELLRDSPLRIGISTRALFDLETEHRVFEQEGVAAYAALQLRLEDAMIAKGCGFEVVDRLLKLNEHDHRPFVEVILLSRNSPDLSLRAFKTIDHYGLPIKLGSFTSGRPIGPFVAAWGIDLFLSNEATDVKDATTAGTASAKLGAVPISAEQASEDEVRVAFDGDAVVFSAESDRYYQKYGLKEFLEYERENARNPMSAGPFCDFLKKLSLLRHSVSDHQGNSKVRIAIVTARNAPAHERVIQTLRAWGTPADEAHFVGHHQKGPILKALRAHIFFDDQEKHVIGAAHAVPAGLVPGPHDPTAPVIPAG